MNKQDRKAALATYKERKASAGIYGLRCLSTGQRWAGRAADLGKIQNRLWFTLRQGGHHHPVLQAAWRTYGPEGFVFEEIERLADESLPYVRDRLLKDRLMHWCTTLPAEAI
ncbi:GIY-YIG nuclease family protein [Ferrovibrio sp.]|uniref:GIY-YIG nuclease family protein n=1 Tax=Ferrovibrio sp. TaxID=1917215 RepID=UPI00260EF859|nr:GIY-YIG nuclease family protein [Ferrovibrio sp.]